MQTILIESSPFLRALMVLVYRMLQVLVRKLQRSLFPVVYCLLSQSLGTKKSPNLVRAEPKYAIKQITYCHFGDLFLSLD